MKKVKFTTVALESNQHLVKQFNSSISESYCIGYTDGKKDKEITGHYFTKELKVKP